MSSINVNFSLLETWWNNVLSTNEFIAAYTASGTVEQAVIQVIRNTLITQKNYIYAYLLNQILTSELANLQQAAALPVSVSSAAISLIQTRTTTFTNAITALSPLQENVSQAVNIQELSAGADGLSSLDFISFLMTFAQEPAPDGLAPATLASALSSQAALWADYATALNTAFPNQEGEAVEALNRQSILSQVVSGNIENLSLGAGTDASYLWNQLAVLPLLQKLTGVYSSGAFNPYIQSVNALLYLIDTIITQLNTLLAVFKEQIFTQVRVITVRQGDSLPNIAARELGNYDAWQQIAAINNIPPPYTLSVGQQLFLPPLTTNTGAAPNYLINYLGVDLYYGPLNEEMLPWNGDFYTISGYNNLTFALGRAITTTIGTLIYHPNYGSRVPTEVGNVETAASALNIGAYANSTILYDPRVQKIITWDVQQLPNNQISYQATILPNGPNTATVSLNLVLQP